MSAVRHEISDLAYTAAAGVAAADCIESPWVLAIITWKLLEHIQGDNIMTGCYCLRRKWKLPAAKIAAL